MTMETKRLEITYRDQPLQIEYFIHHGPKEMLLYLHGLGSSKNDFLGATSTRELQAYTLVAFDFPGCGNSSYPVTIALGIDDLVEITDSFISKLSLGDLVVIGHSMGGLVALLYTKRYGEYVKGFINVEGNLAPEDCFFSREITKHSFAQFKKSVFRNFVQELYQSKNKGFRKYVDTLEMNSSPNAFFDYCPSLVSYSDNGNLIQRFTELNIPKIFIYGSENDSLSYILRLKNKGCEVAEIANSNHFPFYDNPQEYYNVISDFLNRIHNAQLSENLEGG
ncbi:MAG: alpha/beta hydrolase [Syntrophobacterales bacterium]|nr:MAG: alpha/beta hydrolase [Syntrophobacterales bacterium]